MICLFNIDFLTRYEVEPLQDTQGLLKLSFLFFQETFLRYHFAIFKQLIVSILFDSIFRIPRCNSFDIATTFYGRKKDLCMRGILVYRGRWSLPGYFPFQIGSNLIEACWFSLKNENEDKNKAIRFSVFWKIYLFEWLLWRLFRDLYCAIHDYLTIHIKRNIQWYMLVCKEKNVGYVLP